MTAQVIDLFSRQRVPEAPVLSAVPELPEFTPVLSADDLVGYYLRRFSNENTRKEYTRDMEQYREFLDDAYGIDVYDVFEYHVDDWKWYGLEELNGANASVRRRMSSVQGMYRYAMASGYFHRDPFFGVKKPKVGDNVQYTGLNLSDLRRLTYHVLKECDLRTQVVVFGMLFTGLRVSELLNVDIEDRWPDGGVLKLRVTRKGGKPDTVELPHRVAGMVNELAGGRRTGPLLLGDQGRRLAPQVAWRIVRRVGDRFLPDMTGKLHPHDMRHSFVSGVLLVTDHDLKEAQWRAAHADMNNTVRYSHALQRDESTTVEDLASTFGLCG
jgi:integrase/recombinase XerC